MNVLLFLNTLVVLSFHTNKTAFAFYEISSHYVCSKKGISKIKMLTVINYRKIYFVF